MSNFPRKSSLRTGRINYITYTVLFCCITYAVLTAIQHFLIKLEIYILIPVLIILTYVLIISIIVRIQIRRFNDLNMSGWYSLAVITLWFSPMVFVSYAILLGIIPGTPGDNDYDLKPSPPALWSKILAWIFLFVMLAFVFIIYIDGQDFSETLL